jgi:predicted hotdog family 3-hydroxylacyl-ACP dehydratase
MGSDLEELLGIAPPMLWLDEIVARGPRSVRCRLTPRAAHPFAEAGGVEPLTTLEWMGQAAAVLAALLARDAGAAPVARRLSAVSEARFACEMLELGAELSIAAEQIDQDSFSCAVRRDDRVLATALLRLSEHPRGSPA